MMSRFILQCLFLTILITLQVSFIHALPYPFDRLPLVLIVTVYLYQYYSQTTIWWWLICYGFILDVLAISLAPLEVLSYSVSTCMMTLLASRVFTNRSFYGISATAILTLCVLLFSELGIIGMLHLVTQREFLWKHLLFSQLWALLFAGLLILFLFPLLRRAHVQFSKRILS